MEIKLAENIRSFRKQRSMTQEQLAEVLGVTVGAVYKWEAKLSFPELSLIIEMADFFDISVDVLLGYEMKDNRLQTTVERLKKYRHDKDREGLSEAEKALKKHPHSFDIVHESAALYRLFGIEHRQKAMLQRSLALLKESRMLLSQNTDPQISDLTICGEMADVYLMLDEREKALELLMSHNADGIYSDMIGFTLATDEKRPEEAIPFLSEALLKSILTLIRTVMGYVNVFFNKKDYLSAGAILQWGVDVLSGLKDAERPSFLDKIGSVFHVCIACTQIESGDTASAHRSLLLAKELAERFDAAPEYDSEAIRFVTLLKPTSAYDDLGETAMAGIQNTLDELGNDMLSAIWKELQTSL